MALTVAWATNKAKGYDPDLSIFVAFGSFDRNIDSDMVFSSSQGLYVSTAQGGRTGYSDCHGPSGSMDFGNQ